MIITTTWDVVTTNEFYEKKIIVLRQMDVMR